MVQERQNADGRTNATNTVLTNFHKPVSDTSEIKQALAFINEKVHGAGFHFRLDRFDDSGIINYRREEVLPGCLAVLGSFDFCYYYNLEMIFYQVVASNIQEENSWPDHWEKDQLVLLEGDEMQTAMMELGINERGDFHVFAFNIGPHGNHRFYIAAHSFSYYFGSVLLYNPGKNYIPADGERVAYWV